MSDWVRFHRELRQGDKRGLPRSTRFIYMELSQEARRLHGVIPLPIGMGGLDGVCDILGGNRREVVEALRTLTDGPTPMLSFQEIDGKRVLVVTEWEKWNPADRTAAERQQRRRDEEKRKRDANRDVTRDSHGLDRDMSRGVTDPRAHARLSSPLPDLGEGVQGEPPTPEPAESGTMPIRTAHDAMGMCADTWVEGVKAFTGKPFSGMTHGQRRTLVETLEAHCPKGTEITEWARARGSAFAKARAGKTLSALTFADWMNSPEAIPALANPYDGPTVRADRARRQQSDREHQEKAIPAAQALKDILPALAKRGAA